ncbi:hypothetical protein DL240_16805 [Lujinxingia litoralis]|uniref:Uncharacterized protein n=1 Tax=Lujinxingia litoralis TaxID=2211119 RepID=A0A328C7F3_9DELT|nr:hypothetical protein [Lujinxingia litoralis]RAL20464.1 hypothetical protein DL240_16805 [Lujinxingia litoralis]
MILAEVSTGGFTWTPMTFYGAAAVVQLIVILLSFRFTQLNPDYNTFAGALLVAVPVNVLAYFTRDIGLVGVLLTGATLFGLLAAIARADMFRAGVAWVLCLTAYWGMAAYIVPQADGLSLQQVGGLPQVLVEGGLEAEPFTESDIDTLSRGERE